MILPLCRTPEPSPTFDKTEFTEDSTSIYQCNVQTLRNELDKVITQNKDGKVDNNMFTHSCERY
jgi:hypothetical protein